MVVEEILKERPPITEDIRMITNLQNIKNTLKKTHSHKDILAFISNLDFVDSLIKDHLESLDSAQPKEEVKGVKFVPRDASKYRKFFKKLDKVKDRYDPYTNFFLKEAEFHNMTREVLPEKIRKARTKEEKDAYQDILDNMMLTELKREESDLNVGTHVIKRKQFHYDFESLLTDQNEYDIDNETYSYDYSDEHFLERRRRQAETNLIKTKILYKLHEGLALTK